MVDLKESEILVDMGGDLEKNWAKTYQTRLEW